MVCSPRISFIFGRRGAAAIEYAIVLPVLLLLVLGIMDIGRLLWTYATIYRASEAAARCAAIAAAVPAVMTCSTSARTQAYAVAAAWGLTINTSAFTVSNPACGMQVDASYNFNFVVPVQSVTLTTTVCYQFVPPT